MTDEINIMFNSLGVMAAIIAVVCFWILYTFVFRRYWIDHTRHELFKLRDEFWDYGYENGIHETPEYNKVRDLMNGMIRFTHQVSITTVLSTKIYTEFKSSRNDFWVGLKEEIESVESEAVRKELWKKVYEINFIMTGHIIMSSLFFCTLVCITFPIVYIHIGLYQKFKNWFKERKSIKAIDSLAYNYEG